MKDEVLVDSMTLHKERIVKKNTVINPDDENVPKDKKKLAKKKVVSLDRL